MILLREKKNAWTVAFPELDIPLQKGMRVQVERAALVPNPSPPQPAEPSPLQKAKTRLQVEWLSLQQAMNDGKPLVVKPKDTGPLDCRLLDWFWRVEADRSSTLEISVEEARTPLLHRLFATGERFQIIVNTVVVLLIVLALLSAYAYAYPDDGWAWGGRHVRSLVGWCIFVLFTFVLPVRIFQRRSSGSPIPLIAFRAVLTVYGGFAVLGCWLYVTKLPPEFDVAWAARHSDSAQTAYAAYGRALAKIFARSYWPIVLGVLPWAALLFKVFGFDRAEKTSSGLLAAAKSKE